MSKSHLQDTMHHLLVQVCERHCGVEVYAACFPLFQGDSRWRSVKSNANTLKLSRENVSVSVRF